MKRPPSVPVVIRWHDRSGVARLTGIDLTLPGGVLEMSPSGSVTDGRYLHGDEAPNGTLGLKVYGGGRFALESMESDAGGVCRDRSAVCPADAAGLVAVLLARRWEPLGVVPAAVVEACKSFRRGLGMPRLSAADLGLEV